MNKKRKKVLEAMFEAYKKHINRPIGEIGDLTHLMEARRLNEKFISMSRGHGRDKPFIKSVANQKLRLTTFPRER